MDEKELKELLKEAKNKTKEELEKDIVGYIQSLTTQLVTSIIQKQPMKATVIAAHLFADMIVVEMLKTLPPEDKILDFLDERIASIYTMVAEKMALFKKIYEIDPQVKKSPIAPSLN